MINNTIWFIIIYLIGFAISFFMMFKDKEESAQDIYDEYGLTMTNGTYLLRTILYSILSWLTVLMLVLYFLTEFITKKLNNTNIIKSLKTWWNTPIKIVKKNYNNE